MTPVKASVYIDGEMVASVVSMDSQSIEVVVDDGQFCAAGVMDVGVKGFGSVRGLFNFVNGVHRGPIKNADWRVDF